MSFCFRVQKKKSLGAEDKEKHPCKHHELKQIGGYSGQLAAITINWPPSTSNLQKESRPPMSFHADDTNPKGLCVLILSYQSFTSISLQIFSL